MKKTIIALMSLAGVASANFVWNGGTGVITGSEWGAEAHWLLTDGDTWYGTVGPGVPGQESGSNGDKMYKASIVIGKSITCPTLEGWIPNVRITDNSTVTATFNKLQQGNITVDAGSTFYVTCNGDIKDGQKYVVDGSLTLNVAWSNESNLQNVDLTLEDAASFTLQGVNHSGGTITINANLLDSGGAIAGRTLVNYSDATINLANVVCNFGEGWSKVEGDITGAYQYKLTNTEAGLVVSYLIPEPATVTLSLLALAGLAARRCRK